MGRGKFNEVLQKRIVFPYKNKTIIYGTLQLRSRSVWMRVVFVRACALCLVNAMNITASVFINDDEGGLHKEFGRWLKMLALEKPYEQYEHNGYEDNAHAHLKRSVMGSEVVVAVTNGKLDFGTWEQIFYGEFEGMRDKRVFVKIIGG